MSPISPIDYPGAIAAAVRAEFARRGIKQAALPGVIGRSRPTADGRWHGTSPYTATELEKVASFLDLSPYDLNDSAALGARFSVQRELPEVARITPPPVVDAWARPSRSKARRAS